MTRTLPAETVPTAPSVTASCDRNANHCKESRTCQARTGTIGTVGSVARDGPLTSLRVFGNARSEAAELRPAEPVSAIEEEHDFDELDPNEIPKCRICNDLCDTQTLDDAWHCSRCAPESDERRKRTLRWLAMATRIRDRTGTK